MKEGDGKYKFADSSFKFADYIIPSIKKSFLSNSGDLC
ncbi:hypothetical protein CLV50_2223 [Flavobacterium lindanitolerans]|uniref:Uncharacterized protein n=1 Tax=Flavobacterium lindanitolerans TaxID=428988 RepID=A0A497U2C6_9FLAO|nr:hypothetical protein B0G92_1651 [Flavobacterium lindanitolerans]RLJ24342.1 hypothetical protein CLV50_2223 [Flavobacterium lindanitolerans]